MRKQFRVKKILLSLREIITCKESVIIYLYMTWKPTLLPIKDDLESKSVLKKVAKAHRALAELKGIASTIPSQEILINTLTLQEAKDSSAVESIVTTNDELFRNTLDIGEISIATKEVENYVSALRRGYDLVKENKLLTINNIKEIQSVLEKSKSGFRTMGGTMLKNPSTGEVVFTPPQTIEEIEQLMTNLESIINDDDLCDYDPIVKMAIIHFQFESIHPFYDGNGRTGRIINILYLVINELLDIPILYLSRYIINNKGNYYKYLQGVRDNNDWESWLLFMIEAVEHTSYETIHLINRMKEDMMKMKNTLRDNYKFYSQDLLNHLFKQPYTKIDFLMKDLGVSRVTAGSYLNKLAEDNVLIKQKYGKHNYYINKDLIDALM